MEIKITIINSKNEEVSVCTEVSEIKGLHIIEEVEACAGQIQKQLLPILSERLIALHQSEVEGEKKT